MDLLYTIGIFGIIFLITKGVAYLYARAKTAKLLRYDEEKITIIESTEGFDVDDLYCQVAQIWLNEAGFKKMADLTSSANTNTYISGYNSTDSKISAAYYSLRNPNPGKYKYYNVINFESELENGNWIITSTGFIARHIKVPESIDVQYLNQDVPIEDVYLSHVERIKGKSIKKNVTLQNLLDGQARQSKIKWEHRKSLGGKITFSEIWEIDKNKYRD